MVQRTAERAAAQQVADRVRAINLGAHELQRLDGRAVLSTAHIQIWDPSIVFPIWATCRANALVC